MTTRAAAPIATIGLLLAIQGFGGVLNNLFTDSNSWFVLNYLDLPTPASLIGHAAMLAVGLFLIVRSQGWKWLLES